ncbi:MAG: hypothetical protein NZ843_01195, partial [Fimbriimonadales bacterium]|nr:hypothetical protein [Fimbriimonadales bacterium]
LKFGYGVGVSSRLCSTRPSGRVRITQKPRRGTARRAPTLGAGEARNTILVPDARQTALHSSLRAGEDYAKTA